jgi:hypothetical protein
MEKNISHVAEPAQRQAVLDAYFLFFGTPLRAVCEDRHRYQHGDRGEVPSLPQGISKVLANIR